MSIKISLGFLKSKVFFVKEKSGGDWEGDCDVVEITQKDFTPTWGGFVFGVFSIVSKTCGLKKKRADWREKRADWREKRADSKNSSASIF